MTVSIIVGDVRERLRRLPDESVHCVITSPPYWGLRDYETGAWEGGDPDCKHIAGEIRTGLGMAKFSESYRGGGKKVSEPKPIYYRRRCKRCGARRVDNQIGMEPTLGEHLATLVELFREIHRVLRKDGTVWLNYGDCYATAPNGRSAAQTKALGRDDRTFRDKPYGTTGPIFGPGALDAAFRTGKNSGPMPRGGRRSTNTIQKTGPTDAAIDPSGGRSGGGLRGDNRGNTGQVPGHRIVAGGYLKPKDLVMASNMLAMALRDDGWWIRSEIIWAKPNPMPESIKDRPTTSHEKIWLITKRPKYFYDWFAVSEPATYSEPNAADKIKSPYGQGFSRRAAAEASMPTPTNWDQDAGYHGNHHRTGRRRGVPPRHAEFENSDRAGLDDVGRGQGRQLRNVWTIATTPFPQAHFATFPPKLVEPCIKAGTSALGVCPHCGAPWKRLVDKRYINPGQRTTNGPRSIENAGDTSAGYKVRLVRITEEVGWAMTCRCDMARPVAATVLDPFGGAGTVGLVADQLGRSALLIELKPDYAVMARLRIGLNTVMPLNDDEVDSVIEQLPRKRAAPPGRKRAAKAKGQRGKSGARRRGNGSAAAPTPAGNADDRKAVRPRRRKGGNPVRRGAQGRDAKVRKLPARCAADPVDHDDHQG